MVILNSGSESEVLAGLECLQERIAVETKSRTIPLDIAAGMPAAVSFLRNKSEKNWKKYLQFRNVSDIMYRHGYAHDTI